MAPSGPQRNRNVIALWLIMIDPLTPGLTFLPTSSDMMLFHLHHALFVLHKCKIEILELICSWLSSGIQTSLHLPVVILCNI